MEAPTLMQRFMDWMLDESPDASKSTVRLQCLLMIPFIILVLVIEFFTDGPPFKDLWKAFVTGRWQ